MSDFLSTTFRLLRYCTAFIGFVVSSAFIVYGSMLKIRDNDKSIESDLILGVGSLFTVLSCCVGALSRTGDRQVQQLINATNAQINQLNDTNATLQNKVSQLAMIEVNLAAQTTKLEQELAEADARYKARMKQLRDENSRLSNSVDVLSSERKRFEDENNELTETKKSFDETLAQYRVQIGEVVQAREKAAAELIQLRLLSTESDARANRLERINSSQETKIAEMTKHLENLNELQRKSTRKIQMLALYGDECKTLGVSLKDTASELHKTDQSLGLTAGEMSAQVKALQAITNALKDVARGRGADEDSDPEDYNSTSSGDTV